MASKSRYPQVFVERRVRDEDFVMADSVRTFTGLEGMLVEHHLTLGLEDWATLGDILTALDAYGADLKYLLMRASGGTQFEAKLRVCNQETHIVEALLDYLRQQSGVMSAQVEHMFATAR